jgi:hypothetical protein
VKKISNIPKKYKRPPRDDPDPVKAQERPTKQTEAREAVLNYINEIIDNNSNFDELLDAADMVFEGEPNAYAAFVRACGPPVNVPPEVRKYLWNLLTSRAVVTAKSSIMDAPFCWG